MDETLKKRKHAKKSIFSEYFERIRAGRCRERRYAADHIFIQIYFRMHHFVVKFSKFSSPQATRGHWSPNQNPADPPVGRPWSKDGFTPNVTFFLRWPRLAGSVHASARCLAVCLSGFFLMLTRSVGIYWVTRQRVARGQRIHCGPTYDGIYRLVLTPSPCQKFHALIKPFDFFFFFV